MQNLCTDIKLVKNGHNVLKLRMTEIILKIALDRNVAAAHKWPISHKAFHKFQTESYIQTDTQK